MSGYQRPSGPSGSTAGAASAGGAGGAGGAVAVALAVLAVLAVVTAVVVAGVVRVSGSPAADDPTVPPASGPSGPSGSPSEEDEEDPATFFPDGQVIVGDRRDNADVEVPAVERGWEVQASRDIRGFQSETPDGETVTVGVTGPALWETEQCRDDYGYDVDAPRAWAGFTAPGEDDGDDDAVRRANEQVTEDWLRVLRLSGAEQPDPTYEPASISDGTEARRARILSIPTGKRTEGRCDTRAVEVNLLSFDTGDYVATVVVTRQVADDGSDLDGGLPADVVDQVLASPRLQEAP